MPAIAVIRPPPAAGPRLRNLKPRCGPVVSSSLFCGAGADSAVFFSGAAVFFGASAAAAVAASARDATARTARAIFMSLLSFEARLDLLRRSIPHRVLEGEIEKDPALAAARTDSDRERDPGNDLEPARKVVCPSDAGTHKERVLRPGLSGTDDRLRPGPDRLDQHVEVRSERPDEALTGVDAPGHGFLSPLVLCRSR